MALFFTQYVILAIGRLKKPMNLLFEFAFMYLPIATLCVYPLWLTLNSDVCHRALNIYIFMSDFGERLHILSFVFLACFCKFDLHLFHAN